MFLKPRTKSYELQILHSLTPRMEFSNSLRTHFTNLNKGYIGEQNFETMLSNQLTIDLLILPDTYFEVNQSLIQVDTLLFTPSSPYLFEVKNFEGDYFIEDSRWYGPSGLEVNNPLAQLQRIETTFRKLFQQLRLPRVDVKGYVVFPNPEFTLYNAPRNVPIILPTQIPSFLKKINRSSGKLSDKPFNICQSLLENQADPTPYSRIPEYHYDQLLKGVFCPNCHKLEIIKSKNSLSCSECNYFESKQEGLLRNIKEYNLLFPHRAISTNNIYEWCEKAISRKSIQRVLLSEYVQEGKSRSIHYVKSN
ncbi:nuclease-related domain-containing protein [Salipaludibacillus keqinensis]|nr:nuclease-related domain-containing protein [Salipaludibacillus keqinensis]